MQAAAMNPIALDEDGVDQKTIEKEIESFEARKTELNALMVSGTTDHVVLTQWADEISDLDKLISRKSDRWLELSEV